MKIELLKEVDSTNIYIKKYLDGREDVIVCAERQSGGRGTKGRSFLSENGGVYLSELKFYENIAASDAFMIMARAAVAVCKTAERFGAFPEIKWPNDVLIDGKKLAGILIENIFSDGHVKASVVGIGLNVFNDLSGLEDIAISLLETTGLPLEVAVVRDMLIEMLQVEFTFEDYLSRVRFLGKEINILENEKKYRATARQILSDGRLEVEVDGELHILSAAEISIRF